MQAVPRLQREPGHTVSERDATQAAERTNITPAESETVQKLFHILDQPMRIPSDFETSLHLRTLRAVKYEDRKNRQTRQPNETSKQRRKLRVLGLDSMESRNGIKLGTISSTVSALENRGL